MDHMTSAPSHSAGKSWFARAEDTETGNIRTVTFLGVVCENAEAVAVVFLQKVTLPTGEEPAARVGHLCASSQSNQQN